MAGYCKIASNYFHLLVFIPLSNLLLSLGEIKDLLLMN